MFFEVSCSNHTREEINISDCWVLTMIWTVNFTWRGTSSSWLVILEITLVREELEENPSHGCMNISFVHWTGVRLRLSFSHQTDPSDHHLIIKPFSENATNPYNSKRFFLSLVFPTFYISLKSCNFLWIFYTSPSGEKLRAEIAVVTADSEAPLSKFGRPGGPLASKTLIFVILQWEPHKNN